MKVVLFALPALLLAGCGKESIVGIWKGTIVVDESSQSMRRQANRMGNPVLEVKADGTFTIVAGMKVAGKWKETGANRVVFTIETVNGIAPTLNTIDLPASVSEDGQLITVDQLPSVQAKVEFAR